MEIDKIQHFHQPFMRFFLHLYPPWLILGVIAVILDSTVSWLDFLFVIAVGAAISVCLPLIGILASSVIVNGEGITSKTLNGNISTLKWGAVESVRLIRIVWINYARISMKDSPLKLWILLDMNPRKEFLMAIIEHAPAQHPLKTCIELKLLKL